MVNGYGLDYMVTFCQRSHRIKFIMVMEWMIWSYFDKGLIIQITAKLP